MAVEASSMTCRRVFEGCGIGHKPVPPAAGRRCWPSRKRGVTDFAVVVAQTVSLRLHSVDSSRVCPDPQTTSLRYGSQPRGISQSRDHVLMLIVWKLDQKLARRRGVAKRKPGIVFRRHLRIATGTNYGFSTFEELLAMTTYTGVMSGKVSNVGKVSNLFPVVSWNLVASVALALMFFGGVRETRIVDTRRSSSSRSGYAAGPSLLRSNDLNKDRRERSY